MKHEVLGCVFVCSLLSGDRCRSVWWASASKQTSQWPSASVHADEHDDEHYNDGADGDGDDQDNAFDHDHNRFQLLPMWWVGGTEDKHRSISFNLNSFECCLITADNALNILDNFCQVTELWRELHISDSDFPKKEITCEVCFLAKSPWEMYQIQIRL